jgi:GNAT superfamily N-acetyltransferase
MRESEQSGGGGAGSTALIRPLSPADREAALAVINEAARWYRDFLPPEEYHEPEMTAEEWDGEARRLTWFGAFVGGALVGVGGLERVKDVALLRHGYVLPAWQRAGVGARLVERLETEARGVERIVVGTYRGNYKARRALEKAGYRPSLDPEAVLRAYYAIPEPRIRSSLTYEKPLPPR